jgi:hypothetical protein
MIARHRRQEHDRKSPTAATAGRSIPPRRHRFPGDLPACQAGEGVLDVKISCQARL